MGNKRLRVHNTDANNLVSNLRGEVGEIITSWCLLRGLMGESKGLETDNLQADMANPHLRILYALTDKLRDEIVARLAELAEAKVGRLTFHFAEQKLGCLGDGPDEFSQFIEKNRFREKRNYDISHKELPETWAEHRYIPIPYPVLLRGVAMALRLMKQVDQHFLGPSARYLWGEMRKRRYSPMHPPRTSYMILPHLFLSPAIRARVIEEENRKGLAQWEDIETKVNGRRTIVKACRKWAGVVVGGAMLVLDQYPLVELREITVADRKTVPPDQQDRGSPSEERP